MMSNNGDPLLEIRELLQTLRGQLHAQIDTIDKALDRLNGWEAKYQSGMVDKVTNETSVPAESLSPAVDVGKIAHDLTSMDRLYAMLETMELDTSVEREGQLLDAAERALDCMNEIALQVYAEGIFDYLDEFRFLDRSILPRKWWGRKDRSRYRVLGVLFPDERPPIEDRTYPVPAYYFPIRIFLLSDAGKIRTLDATLSALLVVVKFQEILQTNRFMKNLDDDLWRYVSADGAKALRPTVPADFIYRPRPPDQLKKDPKQKHLLGEHNRPLFSVSDALLSRLEDGLRQAVEARQEALRVRLGNVEAARRLI